MTDSALEQYLSLERKMKRLDKADDLRADSVRDAMDTIWYSSLSLEEKSWLNDREFPRSPARYHRRLLQRHARLSRERMRR